MLSRRHIIDFLSSVPRDRPSQFSSALTFIWCASYDGAVRKTAAKVLSDRGWRLDEELLKALFAAAPAQDRWKVISDLGQALTPKTFHRMFAQSIAATPTQREAKASLLRTLFCFLLVNHNLVDRYAHYLRSQITDRDERIRDDVLPLVVLLRNVSSEEAEMLRRALHSRYAGARASALFAILSVLTHRKGRVPATIGALLESSTVQRRLRKMSVSRNLHIKTIAELVMTKLQPRQRAFRTGRKTRREPKPFS